MTASTRPTVCDWCGVVAEDATALLGWTSSVEAGQRRWYCERCSREHVRAIESKLDREWW